MIGFLKSLWQQYLMLSILVVGTLAACVLVFLLVGIGAVASTPSPVFIVDVENKTSDSLLAGRLTIDGRDEELLGVVAPRAVVRFSATVPSEADVGVRFSRHGKADLKAWSGGYFERGDTVRTLMVVEGDSMLSRSVGERGVGRP